MAANSIRVSSPLKWHGGKHYLALKIVALMPRHTHYVEPFFGGGSVLFAKNPGGVSEIVNDIHHELSNFWPCLQGKKSFAEFKRRIDATPLSEVEWEVSGKSARHSGMIGAAVAFFIRCRQSMAGRMDCFSPLTRTRIRRGMNAEASA